MKKLDKFLPIAFAIALSFTIGAPAKALTFANVNGSGDLGISVTGTAYFDFTDLDLTDLNLSADEYIVIDASFPMGVPGTPTDTIDLLDAIGATELSILGDAYFDEFDFVGSLTIEANGIYAIGLVQSVPSGSITLMSSGSISLGAGGSGSSGFPCGGSTAGAVLSSSTGSGNTSDISLCGLSADLIRVTNAGFIIISDTDLVITAAVPEPSAALLFGVGIVSFAAWNRRRSFVSR